DRTRPAPASHRAPSASHPRASSASRDEAGRERSRPARPRARWRIRIAAWCLLRGVGYHTRTGGVMKATLVAALLLLALSGPAVAAPEGTLTWGLHVTLASKWVDAGRIRFHLKEPWPDFMTFYGTSATGAAWVVPKKYVEKVGDDGFLKAPIGAGPYRVVSFQPGVSLVMEAFEGYWRKTPSVKRLVFRSM